MASIIDNTKKAKESRSKREGTIKDMESFNKKGESIGVHIPKKTKGSRNEDGIIGYF